jgi:hypothetical protein
MLQASGLPRLFCDLFIEERESEREESSLSVVDSYCSYFSHFVQFHCAPAKLSEIQNWKKSH